MRAGSLVRRLIVPVAAGLTLATLGGCSGSQGPEPSASGSSPTVTASPTQSTGSPAPSPTWSLTAAEQKAFEEASAAVLAYRQTITDLYSGVRKNLNDMDAVATGALLQDDLVNLQQALLAGHSASLGAVGLVTALPVEMDVKATPPTARIRACIDLTSIVFTKPDGTETRGTRGAADYLLVKITADGSGWRVNRVLSNAEYSSC